jgi:DNA-binding winged helix-turn-helix (wHTH) protein
LRGDERRGRFLRFRATLAPGSFRFERFALDPQDRQLTRDNAPVALNTRYLDALTLLVREHGKLVSKDRFLAEVWAGTPVTDEALTQCVRTLRKSLGDDAARPRFIATVPKHGYRFVAPVQWLDHEPATAATATAVVAEPGHLASAGQRLLWLGGAGMVGGGAAGALGGLFYGLAGVAQSPQGGMGALSVLLVLACVTLLLGLVGGAGVGFGVAATSWRSGRMGPWSLAGGAAGGLLVGAIVKLLGLDAFELLLGRSPGDITGAPEGALLGGAVGLAAWLAGRLSLRRGVAVAGLAGAGGGALITVLGGRLLGGSLDLLVRHFPGARLRLDPIGGLLGESGFGPLSRGVTSALEGALFVGGVVAAMIMVQRKTHS